MEQCFVLEPTDNKKLNSRTLPDLLQPLHQQQNLQSFCKELYRLQC